MPPPSPAATGSATKAVTTAECSLSNASRFWDRAAFYCRTRGNHGTSACRVCPPVGVLSKEGRQNSPATAKTHVSTNPPKNTHFEGKSVKVKSVAIPELESKGNLPKSVSVPQSRPMPATSSPMPTTDNVSIPTATRDARRPNKYSGTPIRAQTAIAVNNGVKRGRPWKNAVV